MSRRETLDLVRFWRAETGVGSASTGSASAGSASAGAPQFVLAELTETSGSTYRKTGAKKIISSSGRAAGLLSGGCLEGAIVEKALEFLHQGGPAEAMFDTSHESDRLLGYQKGCRGQIWVKFQAIGAYEDSKAKQIFEVLADRRRLVIFGCGADARTLSEWLGRMGFAHLMIDHRQDFAVSAAFPEAQLVLYAAPDAAARCVNDGDSVLIMSHSYEADLNFMAGLVERTLPYVGFLGPQARYEQLRQDLVTLLDRSWPEHLQAVSHAPVGIKMPCRDPNDIALSIVAELATLDL